MHGAKVFLDSNVLLYLISDDERKASKADKLLKDGGVVSVQVLNEFASVARRKNRLDWDELRQSLSSIRAACNVVPLTVKLHEEGLRIAERYGFSIYDSMVVAAALIAGCDRLYSEDMQDKQVIGTVTITNPFTTN